MPGARIIPAATYSFRSATTFNQVASGCRSVPIAPATRHCLECKPDSKNDVERRNQLIEFLRAQRARTAEDLRTSD